MARLVISRNLNVKLYDGGNVQDLGTADYLGTAERSGSSVEDARQAVKREVEKWVLAEQAFPGDIVETPEGVFVRAFTGVVDAAPQRFTYQHPTPSIFRS